MNKKSLTVRQVADLLGARLEGDGSASVSGVASLEEASASDVTFVAEARYADRLTDCLAGAAIVGDFSVQSRTPLLHVSNVPAALARLLNYFSPGEDLPAVGISPSATISPDATIGENVAIGPGVCVGPRAAIGRACVLCANVSVGAEVVVGDNTVLFEGVVVRRGCRIGRNVRIGPNSVIGFDGFGYYFSDGKHHRIPHIGVVVIEDEVELGACTCVDRAKFGATRIGAGTKIDNLVQIAHNVQVGENCLMASGVGISGSAKLGAYVVLAGGVGIRDNITLGQGVQCAAMSGVANDVPPGLAVAGVPAAPARETFRRLQALTKLPELLKHVRELEARLHAIESAKND
jgi:UDP-3-O-[3-hydroxymyristoyl] glucosamine N-acyltransferase